jgi:zeaxanthin glucosyltransferase
MRHIGLICPAASHLNPMCTLGRALQRRGYQVSLIALPDAQAKAEAAGLGYIPIGTSDFPIGSMARLGAELGRLKGIRAVRFTIATLLRGSEVILRDAPDAITTARVDALLVDQVSFAGGTVAEKLDLPFVTVCNALALNHEVNVPPPITAWPYAPTSLGRLRNRLGYALMNHLTQPVRALIAARRAAWGLPPLPASIDFDSPLAQIAQQPAEFDFPRAELPSVFHYTGPLHNESSGDPVPFPFERLTNQPIIYASLGTLVNRLHHVFHTIAAACADVDAQLVLSLGSADQELPTNLPGAPIVVPYAPQLQLLDRAAGVITHAGLNTTLESLSRGVPLVAIPITNDQPGVAARIAWVGAGEVIPLSKLSANRLRSSILHVLTQDTYRRCAATLQQAIAQAEGVRRAADITEQALSTRKPVLRQQQELSRRSTSVG